MLRRIFGVFSVRCKESGTRRQLTIGARSQGRDIKYERRQRFKFRVGGTVSEMHRSFTSLRSVQDDWGRAVVVNPREHARRGHLTLPCRKLTPRSGTDVGAKKSGYRCNQSLLTLRSGAATLDFQSISCGCGGLTFWPDEPLCSHSVS